MSTDYFELVTTSFDYIPGVFNYDTNPSTLRFLRSIKSTLNLFLEIR